MSNGFGLRLLSFNVAYLTQKEILPVWDMHIRRTKKKLQEIKKFGEIALI